MPADAPPPPAGRNPSRREQILEALARELEEHPGSRITTARLAQVVGVSEAALYRHFPSKARMLESLIEFAEESIFRRVSRILDEEAEPVRRCELILALLLGFSERNPGITRLLLGEALVGEHERLRERVDQLFSRLETQLKQVLREGFPVGSGGPPVAEAASLLLGVAQGRMVQFSRSRFRDPPTEGWERQWEMVRRGLFRELPGG